MTDVIKILHLYLFSRGAEEGDKLLGSQAQLGLEGIAMHIVEHAAQEGTSLGVFGSFVEVTHHDEEVALSHLAFEDETELVIALEIIDYLHHGKIILGPGIEDERMTVMENGEPLPACEAIGGETGEERLLGIGEDAQRTRREGAIVVLADGLEHAIVPIVGHEERTDSARRLTRREQHLATQLQLSEHLRGEAITTDDVLRQLGNPIVVVARRIDPKRITVGSLGAIDSEMEVHAGRLLDVRKIDLQSSSCEETEDVGSDCHLAA